MLGFDAFLLWTHGVTDEEQENEGFLLAEVERCVLREGVGFSVSWQRQPGVGEEHGCCGVSPPQGSQVGLLTRPLVDHLLSPDTFLGCVEGCGIYWRFLCLASRAGSTPHSFLSARSGISGFIEQINSGRGLLGHTDMLL